MAEAKPEVNRSQLIREFVRKNHNSSVPEVVAALAKNGIEVSKNHVYIVISKMKARKQQKKAAKAAAASESGSVNKSEEIRQILQANPKISAKEVVALLGEKGIKVTDSLVYFVKGKISGRKSRRRRAERAIAQVVTVTPSSNVDAVKTILKVKGWAAEVGGMTKLKALVDALGE